ncbi:energy-coupling factor ABC transporter permease [Gayadomonas joobiniege]|uniref:energy-coupling factor ABC transporter permease n=1 Tax=Gayadomonas joobiniege TaxID=1234606 RepID=UPI00038109F9|nr:energy-coupling factor ABC transporter permease [Gayadomonas joobiniege]
MVLVSILIAAGLLYLSFDKKELSLLLYDKSRQHLMFGFSAFLTFLWSIQTSIHDGLYVHFLGLTACTLFLGPRLAIFSGLLALLINSALGQYAWSELGVHFICGVCIPVLSSYLVYVLSFYRLPRHFLVYVFVCGFLAGALSIGCKMLSLSLYFSTLGPYDWSTVYDNYLILFVLLAFPEALLNGMATTLGIVYKPTWVRTFYDSQYLDDK